MLNKPSLNTSIIDDIGLAAITDSYFPAIENGKIIGDTYRSKSIEKFMRNFRSRYLVVMAEIISPQPIPNIAIKSTKTGKRSRYALGENPPFLKKKKR